MFAVSKCPVCVSKSMYGAKSLCMRLSKERPAALCAERILANKEAGNGIAVRQTSAEWLHDQHARASGCVISLDDPELGPTSNLSTLGLRSGSKKPGEDEAVTTARHFII